jgi:hypothetical protein
MDVTSMLITPDRKAGLSALLPGRSLTVLCVWLALVAGMGASEFNLSTPTAVPDAKLENVVLSVSVTTIPADDTALLNRLTYYWSCNRTTVAMSSNNGLNAGKRVTARILEAGTYRFMVKVTDPLTLDTITGVTAEVVITPVERRVRVTPAFACIFGSSAPNSVSPTVQILDQFDNPVPDAVAANWTLTWLQPFNSDPQDPLNPDDSSMVAGTFYAGIGAHAWTITAQLDRSTDASQLRGYATYVTNKIQIQFRPTSTAGHPDYLPDDGSLFPTSAVGIAWGWDKDLRDVTRNRNTESIASGTGQPLLDRCFAHMQAKTYQTLVNPDTDLEYVGKLLRDADDEPLVDQDLSASWRIVGLPDNIYRVTVISGDLTMFNSTFDILVNGTPVFNPPAVVTNLSRVVMGQVTVVVNNGTISISNGPAAKNNKINALVIAPANIN